ncbi:MAG: response regulator transcription factor [Rhodocyclaceae bacterium]
MIKILIVDDHAVVRSGIRQFLSETDDVAVVAEACNGGEGLALALKGGFDVVVLDVTLPDMNGLEVLKRIRRKNPDLPVLMFSMLAEADFAMPALGAGASGYLSKDSAPEQILSAIRTVAGGNRYVSPFLAEKLLAGSLVIAPQSFHDTLSWREMEVLLLLSKGAPLTNIGTQLHLSVKTVSTYRARILKKLGVESNAQLTRYVLEHKLG